MKPKKRRHSASFETNFAIEASQERESLSELSRKYGIHPNMISQWKKELLNRAPELSNKLGHDKKELADLERFYAKIVQLEMVRE